MLKTDRMRPLQKAALVGALCGAIACGDDSGSANKPDASQVTATADSPGRDASAPKNPQDAAPATGARDAANPTLEPMPGTDAGEQTSNPPSPGTPAATGPDDGDPSKPVVALPSIKCGDSAAGYGLGTANLQVGGRDVILTYPCDKHEGANVTFLLLLHGTQATESLKTYTHAYFAAHTLATSHNLIIAEPKSLASQWGNTTENPDASKDKQHLLDVIDYVYTNFAKFTINSTWIAGHSWGAIYAKQFVCDSTIQDKVRGVIGMSGGSQLPGKGFGMTGGNLTPTSNCLDYISQIHTVGDMDLAGLTTLPDQTAAATKHGCSAKSAPTDIGNMQMLASWPNCTPGWAHEEFTMGAHMHTTAINPEVVLQIVETVKSTEKR